MVSACSQAEVASPMKSDSATRTVTQGTGIWLETYGNKLGRHPGVPVFARRHRNAFHIPNLHLSQVRNCAQAEKT